MPRNRRNALPLHEFQGRVRFFMRGHKLHGAIFLRMPSGRIAEIRTKPHEGVDISHLTSMVSARMRKTAVGGFFGDVWKKAKDTAKKAASKKVAMTLYKSARRVATSPEFVKAASVAFPVAALANKLAMTPEGQQALSMMPGGKFAVTGMKAATLIDRAIMKNDSAAKAQIADIVSAAAEGDPRADQANVILRAVYQLGKKKGAWNGSRSMVNSAPRRSVPRQRAPASHPFAAPLYTPRGYPSILSRPGKRFDVFRPPSFASIYSMGKGPA
jgi:hypothetical protein